MEDRWSGLATSLAASRIPALSPRAVDLLIDIKNWALRQMETAAAEARPQLLLIARTSYISLVTLGREDMANEYIERMYRDDAWDAMNRAFHLEYYNDVDYTPGLELAHEDALQDFPNTFRVLMGGLRATKGTKYAGRNIQFYTLLSLAQHRHAPANSQKGTAGISSR